MQYTVYFKMRLIASLGFMSLTFLAQAGSANLQGIYQQMLALSMAMQQQSSQESLSNSYGNSVSKNISYLRDNLMRAKVLSRSVTSSNDRDSITLFIDLETAAADTGVIHSLPARSKQNISDALYGVIDSLPDGALLDNANFVLDVLEGKEGIPAPIRSTNKYRNRRRNQSSHGRVSNTQMFRRQTRDGQNNLPITRDRRAAVVSRGASKKAVRNTFIPTLSDIVPQRQRGVSERGSGGSFPVEVSKIKTDLPSMGTLPAVSSMESVDTNPSQVPQVVATPPMSNLGAAPVLLLEDAPRPPVPNPVSVPAVLRPRAAPVLLLEDAPRPSSGGQKIEEGATEGHITPIKSDLLADTDEVAIGVREGGAMEAPTAPTAEGVAMDSGDVRISASRAVSITETANDVAAPLPEKPIKMNRSVLDTSLLPALSDPGLKSTMLRAPSYRNLNLKLGPTTVRSSGSRPRSAPMSTPAKPSIIVSPAPDTEPLRGESIGVTEATKQDTTALPAPSEISLSSVPPISAAISDKEALVGVPEVRPMNLKSAAPRMLPIDLKVFQGSSRKEMINRAFRKSMADFINKEYEADPASSTSLDRDAQMLASETKLDVSTIMKARSAAKGIIGTISIPVELLTSNYIRYAESRGRPRIIR